MQSSIIIADPIADFKKNLPSRPYCSKTKRIESIKPKDGALKMPYIQCNHPHRAINYIVFDLDFNGSALAARDNDVAEPTLTVINPINGHSHAFYQIDPIHVKKATTKSKVLMKDVIDGYRGILKADKAITTQKQLVKNPLCERWEVIVGKAVTLAEMAEYLPYAKRTAANTEHHHGIRDFEDCIGIGRNCSMFEFIRHHAYATVSNCKSQDELLVNISTLAIEKNTTDLLRWFKTPLNAKEMHDICKSIARWTWAHRDAIMQGHKNIGVMGFEKRRGVYIPPAKFHAETRRRQAIGGEYAARKRILNQLAKEGIVL